MEPKIFKAYDIRGVYPAELDEAGAKTIAQAFVKYINEGSPGKKTIVVGRDMRLSSPKMAKKVIEGLRSMGADVIDIGCVSSPTFYYAVGRLEADGGMQVSASHNPAEYNGLKVVKANAYPVGLVNGLDRIRDFALTGGLKETEEPGKLETVSDMTAEVAEFSKSFYEFKDIKPFKVVADVANAMGSVDLEELFKGLPCELTKMNFKLDGTFPAHQADPMKPENIKDLQQKVIEEEADIGIATDGDGDRIFFIDNKGELIDPAIVRGMLAEYVLRYNPGANIGYDIRPGMITRDMIVEHGGKPFVTKVGHSLIKLEAIKKDAPFSGESSGHFFFKNRYGIFELPMVATLIILEEMSEKCKPLSEIVRPLKKYSHSGEINLRVKDTKKTMQLVQLAFAADAKNISTLDGVLIEHEDYWFNVRGSNTEPVIRLNLEARTKEKMEEMRDKVLEVMKKE